MAGKRLVLQDASAVDDMYDLLLLHKEKFTTADEVGVPAPPCGDASRGCAGLFHSGPLPGCSCHMLSHPPSPLPSIQAVCSFLSYLAAFCCAPEGNSCMHAEGDNARTAGWVQVRQDDLLEHAEAYIKALRAGKEFIADTKPFQVCLQLVTCLLCLSGQVCILLA